MCDSPLGRKPFFPSFISSTSVTTPPLRRSVLLLSGRSRYRVADLVLFLFLNLCPRPWEKGSIDRLGHLFLRDLHPDSKTQVSITHCFCSTNKQNTITRGTPRFEILTSAVRCAVRKEAHAFLKEPNHPKQTKNLLRQIKEKKITILKKSPSVPSMYYMSA